MLIPKTMNFYWGGESLSFLQYMTIVSFNKFNPTWKIIVHTPIEVSNEITWATGEQNKQYTGKDFFCDLKEVPNVSINVIDFNKIGFYNQAPEVFKSDYFRWYLLSTNGGGWSDIDILYLKSIDELLTSNIETVICFGEYGNIIGFLMSKPNNPFFKRLFDNSFRYFNHLDYQSIGSKLMNIFYPREMDILYEFPATKNLDMSTFYKINHLNIEDLFYNNKIDIINDDVFGVHWYNGSDIAKDFNNQYPNTTNCTINEILKRIL